MKIRLAVVLATLFVLSSVFAGCTKKASNTNAKIDIPAKQKIVVVVVDKQTKTPVKDAKVYIVGDEKNYATDDMGKTQEILVDVNKDYFNKYVDEVSSKVSCGFINLVIQKEGYSKHLEMDYSIFPGDSAALVKVELEKGKKATTKCNTPDVNYIENLVRGYEKFEGEQTRSDGMLKYNITVVDQNKKPVEGVKVVIPESKVAANTDKKGTCEVQVPYDESSTINYPVKKNYGEMTVLTYKEGYSSKAVFKAQINKDGKNNSITVVITKTSKTKIEYEVVKPMPKWTQDIINSYK